MRRVPPRRGSAPATRFRKTGATGALAPEPASVPHPALLHGALIEAAPVQPAAAADSASPGL